MYSPRPAAGELAQAGATVLIHGRDPARGEQTLAQLREQTGNERLAFYRADFSALEKVRAFGEQILAEQPVLHTLVNNAGIGTTLPGDGQRMQSNDGHELRAVSTLEEGVHATVRLITDTALAGVSGKYFKGQREDRANAQAYDPDARRQLRELSQRLTKQQR